MKTSKTMQYLSALLLLSACSIAIAQTEMQRSTPAVQSRLSSSPSSTPKEDAELKAILKRLEDLENPKPIPTQPMLRPIILPEKPGTIAWKLTRRNGDVYFIKDFVEQGKLFLLHDLGGNVSTQLVESVARIEPLTAEELKLALVGYEHPSIRLSKVAARTEARTSARSTARSSDYENNSSVDYGSTYSYGYGYRGSSNRGSGYYTGPRQPAGHYAGGMGSSHAGGHYVNSFTGNHYQRRH